MFFSFILSSVGCYSFKGISIPAEANTFYVDDFTITAVAAPPDINQKFAEALRFRIVNESRLTYDTENSDLTFSGSVTKYRITSEAPIEGNTTALNRLEIVVSVKYEDILDEENNWTQNFSFFESFDSNVDIADLEAELQDNIITKLSEDVFNKAFTNW